MTTEARKKKFMKSLDILNKSNLKPKEAHSTSVDVIFEGTKEKIKGSAAIRRPFYCSLKIRI